MHTFRPSSGELRTTTANPKGGGCADRERRGQKRNLGFRSSSRPLIAGDTCSYTGSVGEYAPRALPVFTGNGQPLALTRRQRQALGGLLIDPATRGLLNALGLDAIHEGGELRFRTLSLHAALHQLWRTMDEAPPWTQRHPLLDRDQLRSALDSVGTLTATAPPEVAMPCAAVMEPLSLVAPIDDPSERLMRIDGVNHTDPVQLLEMIDSALLEMNLPKELLCHTLIPMLADDATCGLAARLLGRSAIAEAVPDLDRALARTSKPDNRLEILGALVKLGHRGRAFGTLRSIVAHGAPGARRQAVRLLDEVATRDDVATLYEILRASHLTERVPLAGLLYRLGDLRAYAHLDTALADLSSTSSSRLVDEALEVVQLIGSKRFIPSVEAYAARETRRWFAGRAQSTLEALRATGTAELTIAQLVDAAERAWNVHQRLKAIGLLDELLALDGAHARGLYLKANYLKEQGDVTEALKTAQLAVGAAPTDWRVQRLYGSLLWDKGRGTEALVAYDRALKLEPTDAYTWYYKGYVLYRLERHDEALPCLDRALSLKSDEPSIQNQKGFCLERLDRHEEAVRCYKRSLRMT
ncbi:MAG: tetratricopeptide repeat protein, partial [Myxococcota bacterium]|nr:tetratricopeptide repeat protein [Myxococcota bacterium]